MGRFPQFTCPGVAVLTIVGCKRQVRYRVHAAGLSETDPDISIRTYPPRWL